MDVDAFESCKENIQPLKQGRRTDQLQVAIEAQTNEEINQKLIKQRQCYEMAIVSYEGDDPLAPRWEYLCWLEQAYPRHAFLEPLLEDTISTFKQESKYRNDPRFVQFLIKYIERQSNALEMYQTVYSDGLGTMCSYLYKAWAEELDRTGDWRRADQVFQLGISNRSEPRDELVQAHMMFQLSVGRRVLHGNFANDEKEADKVSSRMALGKISSKKVTSIRASQNQPGVLHLQSPSVPLSNHNVAVKPFAKDEEILISGMSSCNLGFSSAKENLKENLLQPGTWNKTYNKKHVSVPCTSVKTPFKVHVDEKQSEERHPVPQTPHVLRTRKEEFHCPLAVFEPEDPSVMPMYCKKKIYAGGGELQLEEIRAAIYSKKYLLEGSTSKNMSIRSFYTPDKSPFRTTGCGTIEVFSDASEGIHNSNMHDKFKIYCSDSNNSEFKEERDSAIFPCRKGRELVFDSSELESHLEDSPEGIQLKSEPVSEEIGNPPSSFSLMKHLESDSLKSCDESKRSTNLKFSIFVDDENPTVKCDSKIDKEQASCPEKNLSKENVDNKTNIEQQNVAKQKLRSLLLHEDLPKPHFPESLLN